MDKSIKTGMYLNTEGYQKLLEGSCISLLFLPLFVLYYYNYTVAITKRERYNKFIKHVIIKK